MFKKKDSEQTKGKKPVDKAPSKKATKAKKEKAPIEKKIKEKKPKQEKALRQKNAQKEGGGNKTVVLAVVLIVILVGAIASVFYPSIIGNKKPTVPTSFGAKNSGAENIRTIPARKPGETPAAQPRIIDEETGETPDALATEIASSAPPALRTPVQPATPPEKTVAATTPPPPSTLPAVGTGALIPPPAARRPIVVNVPPVKEALPTFAGSPEKFERSVQAQPATIVVEKTNQENETAATGIAVAKNPKRKTPHFNKNEDERKTIIDEKDDIFIPRGSMDDLFSWTEGKSFGSSKSLTKKSPDTRYSTVSDINSELKLEKKYYMVLIKESNNVEELRRLASNLKINTPAPEIKATVSFGRPVYWLTVGHYTSEYKAFNKAHEIREKGFPTTIVSENVFY